MRRNRFAAVAVGGVLAVCGTGLLAGEASAAQPSSRLSVTAEPRCDGNRVVLKVTVRNESRRDVRGEVRTPFGDRRLRVEERDSATVYIRTGERRIDDGRVRYVFGGWDRRGDRAVFDRYDDKNCGFGRQYHRGNGHG